MSIFFDPEIIGNTIINIIAPVLRDVLGARLGGEIIQLIGAAFGGFGGWSGGFYGLIF